jgi:hypothetical protein
MKPFKYVLVFVLLQLPAVGFGGVYADHLSKCLVDSTSKDDRTQLVRWMFAAASAHPEVRPLTAVSQQQLDEANRIVAEMFVNLLVGPCLGQTRQALQYEGLATMETAFGVLGQVAGRELFSTPEVEAALAGIESFIDVEKLEQVIPDD